MTLSEALTGKDIPGAIHDTLALVTVPYLSFGGLVEEGHLVVHESLADDIEIIFTLLLTEHFPIEKMVPVNEYAWDDERSMQDNNTSAFNYRAIAGTERLSNHALGRAIDINPRQNPQITGAATLPANGLYVPGTPGTIMEDSPIVRLFLDRGWEWGGHWQSLKDYQHFEKPISE